MARIARDELVIIRHAPADHGGRLCGRRDVDALLPDAADLAALRARLAGLSVVTSPARRCQQTAAALFPGIEAPQDARLWEQDFGAHEGLAFTDLPDLGVISRAALADHRSPQGESFRDMVTRVTPALRALAAEVRSGGPMAVVAHAGTARAALGLALGDPAQGLAFEIAPLSLTRLRVLDDTLSIIATNTGAPA